MPPVYETLPAAPAPASAPAPARVESNPAAKQSYAAGKAALAPKPSKAKKPKPGNPSAVKGTFTLGGATYELADGVLRAGKTEAGRLTDPDALAAALEAGAPPASVPAVLGADATAQTVDLAASAVGSTFKYGSHAWTLYDGTWQELKRHEGKGYAKFGGGTVLKGLTQLNDAGLLGLSSGKMVLTPEQIAILNAIAQVETSGLLGGVNTYDNMVVSLGFKQVTLGWGSLEQMMDQAPAGFAKHGLSLDKSKT